MRAPRLAAGLVALSMSTPLLASETATVIGRVTDASGAVVPGVTVTARNVDTGISRVARDARMRRIQVTGQVDF